MSGCIEQLEVAGSHREIGFAIGERFSSRIRRSLESYAFFREHLLPHYHTAEGRTRYQRLLEVNQARFPDYVAELEGLAQGAQLPFRDLLLVNLRGDYLSGKVVGGCTDVVVFRDDAALIGHNEDGDPAFQGELYLARVQVEGKPAFTALCYPGFLPGNAFGFNSEGICFSVDSVRPRDIPVGLGRYLVARSLLDATSLTDAIGRAMAPGRSGGFSVTIGSITERRIVVVEAAPGAGHVREIQGHYVHTNHYRDLAHPEQVIGASSRARLERAQQALWDDARIDATGVLALLGDEADERYPIFRTAVAPDRSATLCTALFDLDSRQVHLVTGHPTRNPEQSITLTL